MNNTIFPIVYGRYMDHNQECLQVCQNTHWVMNSTEKAIMKFHRANTLSSLTPYQVRMAPYPEVTLFVRIQFVQSGFPLGVSAQAVQLCNNYGAYTIGVRLLGVHRQTSISDIISLFLLKMYKPQWHADVAESIAYCRGLYSSNNDNNNLVDLCFESSLGFMSRIMDLQGTLSFLDRLVILISVYYKIVPN